MPYPRSTTRRAPRRRLNPVVGTAAHLAYAAARAAARKYGARAAAGAAAAGSGYLGYKVFKKKPARRITVKPLEQSARKRPRTDGDSGDASQGGYVQEARRVWTTGRKEDKGTIARTLNSKDLLSRSLFWKKVPAQFSGANGTMYLSQFTGTAGFVAMPIYMFDLTQLQGTTFPMATRLWVPTATGLPFFHASDLFGQDAANGSVSGMSVLRSSPDFPSAAQPYIHYGSANVNMVLYGNTQKNTTFNLSLVQFPDADLAPCDDNRVSNASKVKFSAFWQERIRRYITHPCELSVKYSQSKMKVLRSKQFKIAPTSTTESDATPHHLIVKWRHHINKTVGMRLGGSGAVTTTQETDARLNPTDTTGSVSILTESPRVKDRVYLLVECNDWLPAATEGSSNAPSFDASFLTTHYVTV